jgi:hypothetical protein
MPAGLPASKSGSRAVSCHFPARICMSKNDEYEYCPRCGGEIIRIRRRLFDRFLSLFRPVRRFRCASPGCEWRGNLRR